MWNHATLLKIKDQSLNKSVFHIIERLQLKITKWEWKWISLAYNLELTIQKTTLYGCDQIKSQNVL